MMRNRGAMDALFLVLPDILGEKAAGTGVFLRAVWHESLSLYSLVCVQTFKPLADDLSHHGIAVETTLPESATFALYAATRHREENRLNLARLWRLLPAGGWLVCCQHNDLGAKALEKDCRDLAGDVGSSSKFHSRVIWAQKTDAVHQEILKEWLSLGTPRLVEDSTLLAAPGMFSWQKADKGSALLAEYLPADLSGRGADIGAGWGYLSHHVLKNSPAAHIDLYEAEKTALDMARVNLAPFAGKAGFFWKDVQAEKLAGPYDFIVCNPPFHHMDAQDNMLGQNIVLQGFKALKSCGRMFVVANRHLPYEKYLAVAGAKVTVLADKDGYRVLEVRS